MRRTFRFLVQPVLALIALVAVVFPAAPARGEEKTSPAGLAKALFGYQDPVGDHLRISGIWYRVVGVFADRNAPSAAGATSP